MPGIIRKITGRLRRPAGTPEEPGDLRAAPRFKQRHALRVLFSLSVLDAAAAGGPPLSVRGRTRDISRTGVGLILPSLLLGGRDFSKGNRPLLIELELPEGPVRFQALIVRVEELEAGGEEEGYLMGVRITGMGKNARARLDEFLREARRGGGAG